MTNIIKGYIKLGYYWILLNIFFPLLERLVEILIKLNSMRKDA